MKTAHEMQTLAKLDNPAEERIDMINGCIETAATQGEFQTNFVRGEYMTSDFAHLAELGYHIEYCPRYICVSWENARP